MITQVRKNHFYGANSSWKSAIYWLKQNLFFLTCLTVAAFKREASDELPDTLVVLHGKT